MIKSTAGCGHDDVDTGLEGPQLTADGLATVDRNDPDPELAAVVVKCLGDLHGQLTGWHEDQCQWLSASFVRGKPLQDREGEGRRLSRSGGGLSEHVVSLEEHRYGCRLNRRRFLVTQCGERVEQLAAQAQLGEGNRMFRGRLGHRGPCYERVSAGCTNSNANSTAQLSAVRTEDPGSVSERRPRFAWISTHQVDSG